MLHPIGSRPPGVYWRRRLALGIALLALIAFTMWVLSPGSEKKKDAAAQTSPTHSTGHSTRAAGSTPARSASGPKTKPASTSAKPSGSHSVFAAPCQAGALKVAAVVERPTYRVGEHPMVLLQVTNTGAAPCVQDLADSQVELRVYNGESRVWGSHDCLIEPGVAAKTLAVGQPVRVSVVWSGLSSQPSCAGTRQRVGAGTYTLYALLSGKQGTAAQFSVS
ncbi:MAG: hypothetical protein DLM58_07075 [Pseudonocardiales bacterium]|nr:MAG: hypothetical protein DLM58_07075 [Pseudonocardiales bacterium]